MNTLILIGRLTDNAEVKTTTGKNSFTVARFTLAVQDKSYKNDDNEHEVDYIKCVAYGKLADVVKQYTKKGSELLTEGKLHTYSYENKEDKKVYMAENIVERLEFLSSNNSSNKKSSR